MTKNEAIDKWIIPALKNTWNETKCEEVLKALEQEPCEDCVSRQVISDYVESHIQEINTGYGDLNKHTNEILRMIIDYIESMPSVTPKQKTGHWYRKHCSEICFTCSECGITNASGTKYNYCPSCGAKMVEPKGSEV